MELAKFTVQPSGMTPYTVLGLATFDPTRSAEAVRVAINTGGASAQVRTELNASIENPNDDSGNTDEDSDLVFNNGRQSTDALYMIDAPSGPAWTGVTPVPNAPAQVHVWANGQLFVGQASFVLRFNGYDSVFVSVTTGANSRSSVFYPWHSMYSMAAVNPANPTDKNSFERSGVGGLPVAAVNKIGEGTINVNNPGG